MNSRQLQLNAISEVLNVCEISTSDNEKNIGIKAALKLLAELKEENSDLAEINYLQGFAWYLSAESEERDDNVLSYLSAALELDFEHIDAKVYLCHYLFDMGDHAEFLKHYQQLSIIQFAPWRKLKFLEMNVIARSSNGDLSPAICNDYISKYENASDNHQPVISELYNFSKITDDEMPKNLDKFINKWSKYWRLDDENKH